MAIIKKYIQKQGLAQYKTWITDTGASSDYFKLSQVPDTLRAGKNGFLINGSPNLIRTTDIRMEIIDSDGNTVFLQPIKNYQEGLARVVSIEVYDDTPTGPAMLTILGEAAYDLDGTPSPSEWRGTYNVKWQKLINIEPFRANNTPVRVYNKPVLDVSEYLASVITFQPGAVNTITTGSISGPYWTYPSSGSWYGAPPSPDSLTTLITATQPIFVANSLYGGLIATASNTIYSGTIIGITSTTKATVSFGIPSSSAGTWYASGYQLQYQDPSTPVTSVDSRSYAHLSITDLTTFTGDIQRAKVYMRGTDTNEVYSLLDDIILEAIEITSVTSSVGTYDSMGDITTQGVIDAYWEAGILGNIISGTIRPDTTYIHSSPSTNVTASYNDSILNDSVVVTGTGINVNNTAWVGISRDLFVDAGIDYTLEANITCVKSNADPSELQIRLYNSESLNVGSSDTLGYLIETFDLGSAISKEFGLQTLAFTSPVTGNTRLRFVTTKGGNWHISNVKLTVASETGFNPSEISRIIPITNRQNETLQFKVDLLDGAYSVIPITLETVPIFFTGSAVAAAPGGGTAESASYAVTSSYTSYAASSSYFSGSALFPNGLTVTGSITASVGYSGFLFGTASYALNSLSGGTGSLSSSYALTASYASNAGGASVSASWAAYAVTASYISGAFDVTQGLIITGSVISFNGYTGSLLGTASYAQSSLTTISSSYALVATSASYALTSSYAKFAATASYLSGTINFPNGLIVTGSISASSYSGSGANITGIVSSSYALTSSYASNAGGFSRSGSFTGSFTGSLQGSASYALTSSYAKLAATASYLSGTINFPNGLIVTGSITASYYTGSFTGSVLGSSSYALTSSYASNAVNVISSSYALTSSYASNAVNVSSASYALTSSYAKTATTASYLSGTINFPNGLIVTGSVTASAYSGSGINITGIISSSYALTSSYAANAGGASISSSYALTSSYASNAVTSSYAKLAATASFLSGTINFPNGLIVTGSVTASYYTGSFTGSLRGSSSYASTASAAGNFYVGGRIDTQTSTAGVITLGNVAHSTSLNLSAAQGFTAINTGSVTFVFSSPPSGLFGFILKLSSGSNGSPSRTTIWPNTVRWESGSTPQLSSFTDLIGFVTFDAGTTWYGNRVIGRTS